MGNFLESARENVWFLMECLGVFALVVLICLALMANFLWKLYLMRAEKKLIDQGRSVAVK